MSEIENFIDAIHASHINNAQQAFESYHFGRSRNRRLISVSPLPNFVFEFFLYNSLYAIDWEQSYRTEALVEHGRGNDVSETDAQDAMELFCRKKCESNHMIEAFTPLVGLTGLSDPWTEVIPDARVKKEEGENFFRRVSELAEWVASDTLRPTKKCFSKIEQCRRFVYSVRCNIFHGTKPLGEILEPSQAKRLAVYDLFLRCLNSLFFLAMEKEEYGSAFAQLPIVQQSRGFDIDWSVNDVYELLSRWSSSSPSAKFLKPEDSFLHWKCFRDCSIGKELSVESPRALFYPSAGVDFLFPLLVGMPTCIDFFFYDSGRYRSAGNGMLRPACSPEQAIQKLLGTNPSVSEVPQEEVDGGFRFEFTVASIPRRVWCMRQDNKQFLDRNETLGFYFHRGDSEGEGGCGQKWDSELLPALLAKSDPSSGCQVLTDGVPCGLVDWAQSRLDCHRPANSSRNREYYYGWLMPEKFTLQGGQ